MAKKRKHQKTDKRSAERRAEQQKKKAEKLFAEKQTLLKDLYTRDEMADMISNNQTIDKLSLRKLKKERAEKIRAKQSEEYQLPNEEAKKFFDFLYQHQPKNTQNHKWFRPMHDLPFFAPENKREVARDKRRILRLQEILNNPDTEQARRQFRTFSRRVIKSAGGYQVLRDYMKEYGTSFPASNLNIRQFTSFKTKKARKWLDYENYLEAAKQSGCDELVYAIIAGGQDFTEFMYRSKPRFDWKDFYPSKAARSSLKADRAFFNWAKQILKQKKAGKFENLLQGVLDAYRKKKGWV